ncbi:hypothetical protein [Streptomyces sp. NPDC002889]|uniref:hypothetical protein n=1 Tax=Streptomyces sp. NPDC002889 TaxID=3364669 RepID=UPI0036A5FD7C
MTVIGRRSPASPTRTPRTQPGAEQPAADVAEVRIIASSPEGARRVAEAIRAAFATSEQRSYPTGRDGEGTRLHLTVDTSLGPTPPGPRWIHRVTDQPHEGEV